MIIGLASVDPSRAGIVNVTSLIARVLASARNGGCAETLCAAQSTPTTNAGTFDDIRMPAKLPSRVSRC
jgi:hypothetical protein